MFAVLCIDEDKNSLSFLSPRISFCQQTKTALHRSSSDVKAPTKSAMKQISSLSANSRPLRQVASEPTKDETSKGSSGPGPVPFGMPGASVPHNKGGPTGYVSPQYGWYVTGSTTPPTPEMYAHPGKGIKSSAAKKADPLTRSMKNMAMKDSSPLQSSAFITMKGMKPPTKGQRQDGAPHHRRKPTPQFTKNNKAYGNSMGWPSVPL
jgi:hypothetical protein